MQNWKTTTRQISGSNLRVLGVAALGMALTALPRTAHAERIPTPPVPPEIQVPANTRAFFVGHAVGTQNYVCLPSGSTVAWTLFTPQATLFDDNERQATTHFFSPNPFESGVVRATWEDSQDTSTVWGQVLQPSSDPAFVKPGAVAWLLVQVVGAQEGPTGGARLLRTSFIQRLNTVGGSAPSTGCAQPKDIGSKAFVPYTADYFFYRTVKPRADDGTR